MGGNNTVLKSEFELSPVPEVLPLIYKSEELVTIGVVPQGSKSADVYFSFGLYPRTVSEMNHVSAMWMTAAVMEGFYCVLDNAIRSGDLSPQLSVEWLHQETANFVMLKSHFLYRQQVELLKPTPLSFSLLNLGIQRFRKRMLSVTVGFEGFCSGEVVGVITPPEGYSES